nr:reverse transcriptase zinc-binding domain-containing protein [Tanacetum cinerariifolium]
MSKIADPVGKSGDHIEKTASNSFASVLQAKSNKKVVKIQELRNENVVEGDTIAIPFEAVEEKTMSKTHGAKYGLKRVQLHDDFFLFQFENKDGMDKVLEDGPWLIRTVPLILNIFDHHSDKCPKLVKDLPVVNDADEGFVEVKKKKHKNKNKQHKVVGLCLPKPQPQLLYRRVERGETFQKVHTDKVPIVTQAPELIVKNSFEPLDENEGDGFHDASLKQDDFLKVSDSEVDEEFQVDHNGNVSSNRTRASTPANKDWTSNGAWCNKGTQIVMEWNHNDVDVVVIDQDDQVTHTRAHAMFKPYRVFDHTQSVLCIRTLGKAKPKPFKFFNVLTTHELFLDVVKTEWVHYIRGFFMFRVVKKLKNLKKPLRKLLYDKGNVHANVNKLRTDLDAIQTALDADPFNVVLCEREATCVIKFNEAVLMEECFLQQKAKIQWLKEGDANSAYFYKAVKSRVSRSRINTVTNSEGVVFDNNTVHVAFVKHYEMFLGQEGETSNFNYANLFNVRLNDQESQNMVREISNQEVKDAVFSIGNDKSPGPNGFTAAFFKEAWNIIANDVYLAVSEFFRNGTILKEISHTIISLLPKVKSPSRVNDYRPISCCNVLFKCISKIIANRIKHSLKTIISPNQSVFILGQSITDNILLTQELMHNYHLERDVGSASIINEALDEFKNASSLVPSLPKSTAYFCNVLNHVKLSILQILPFKEGKLSVKYLGVPLVSSRLMIRDCNELVDKLMRQFLWSHESSDKGKSKVAWEIVFLPKHEGGLGIRRLECFNSALMASHIWKLLTLKESLWRKILKLRLIIQKFIWSKIGNGRNTSLWFDTWANFEPLAAQISPRDIARSGLSLQSKVQDVIHHRLWVWPQELLVKYPFLNNHNTPIREDARDSLVWRNIHGNVKKFQLVKFGMIFVIVTLRKLKTQDLVPMWDVSDSLGMVCSLCESVPDSHDHLFFECPFAKGIWDRVKVCAGLAHYTGNIYDIIQSLMPIMKRRTTNSVVAKLVVRLFKKGKRSPDQIVECIKSFVRLKLLSCKLKKSKNGERLARLWDLPEVVF